MAWVPTAAELLTIAHGTLGNTKVNDIEALAEQLAAGSDEPPMRAAALTMQAILAADPCERSGETAALAMEACRVVLYLNGFRVGKVAADEAAELLASAPDLAVDELVARLRSWLG